MKRFARLALAMAAVLVLFAACEKETDIDEEELIGTWDATDGFWYTFESSHSGRSGDAEGSLPYTWELESDALHLRFTGNGIKNKSAHLVYVIDRFTGSRMEAYDQDDYMKETIVFTKR